MYCIQRHIAEKKGSKVGTNTIIFFILELNISDTGRVFTFIRIKY